MRHSYISFIIIAGIALLSSCARVSEIEQPTEAQKGTYTYTISASSQDTKTSYDAEGHFSWTAGDAISVLFHKGSDNKFFTLTTSNSGALASFTGEIEDDYTIGASDGDEFDKKIWALFPASDKHSYTAANDSVSFYVQPEVDFTTRASANIPMYDLVAAEGEELYFKSLTGNYKFILKVKDHRINKVKAVVYNQQTYGLSGNWPVKVSDKTYINYGYAAPGSEKSTLTYTCNVNHVDSLAEFYVSSCYWGKFQPSISIYDAERDYLLTELNATKIDTAKYLNKVQPITIAVNTETYIPAINIDGSFSDWDDVPHVITTSDSKIVEWRYTTDSKNLYFLYKVAASKVTTEASSYDWDPYIYVGLDTNNDETKGSNGGGGTGDGMEARLKIFPWRGSSSKTAECIIGKDSNGEIDCPVGTEVAKATVGGKFVGDYCYVEVCVPMDKIGSPSGPIAVNHAMNYYSVGRTQIMPEIASITAEDQTVDIGETKSIGATTNSTATLSYSSNDTEVATVDANGIITGVAAGTATITVSALAVNGEYSAASKDITVTVTTPFTPSINIDGDLSDWDGIEAFTDGGNTGRIKEWKFKSDERFVYVYLALRRNRAGDNKVLYVGFDTDNDSSSGTVTYGMTIGMESYATLVPFTNSGNATTPIAVTGYDAASVIHGTSSTTNGKVFVWDYDEGDELQPLSSDFSRIFIELSIPRDKLGLPAAGTEITVQCCYENAYYSGAKSVTLE